MRFAASAFLLGLCCAGLPDVARAAEPDTYIFDVLALQPYKGNFARLVKDRAVPDWVKAIAVQGAGTAGPSRTVDVGGTPYRLDRVCRVDACAGNTLDVLWAPRGARVWAALVEGGKPVVMLGHPKDPQARALAEAASGALPPAARPAPAAPTAATASAVPVAAPPSPQPAPAAEPDPYIFDVLPLQPYKGNFARLVKAPSLPGWVHAIATQGAGAAGPAKTVAVAGAAYRLDRVCKVGAACATDRLDVLWAPRGGRVWGALVEDGRPPVMLGDPKGPQAEALAATSAEVPAAK
ncbi:Ivy family c-type lysozyme inhibitor [Lichenibacterium dinghuense]|uniref:Ivy family c-type lysozyme inhibitor n=1 Tax=Lichenibacterium dinghuense TaxID=2895977 RepID=UPI001F46A1CB|nr:Ivy family c-type lysozyme inhibitor [Lichenibacterium sp. 6Y81]